MSDQDIGPNEGQEPQTPPTAPPTPPTQPGPLARPANYAPYASAPPVWPTVIGTIGIVFGAAAVLMTLGGAAFSLMLRNAPNAPPMPQFDDRWMPWTLAVMVLTCAVALMLLVAGIGIAQRRRWGPRVATVWAPLKIVIVAVSTFIGFQTQKAVMTAANPSGGPPMPGGIEFWVMLGGAFSLIWGWALPVFLLIWFSRASVKDELSKWP